MSITEVEEFHQPTRTDLLRAALDYAALGWPVHPLRPGGKEPLVKDWPNAATTDRARIHAWWSRWPNANIGLVCGERSGLLALDVDHPFALDELEAERGELPATRTHSTGSGGMHILFRYPTGSGLRNTAGKLGDYLDTRGDGGYIVVPPSRTERAYTILDDLPLAEPPEWLVEALREPQSARSEARPVTPPVLDRGAAVSLDSPGPIEQGRRDATLARIAGRLHDGTRDLEALTGDLLAINAERCDPPLPERQVEKIARSIYRREPSRRAAPTVTPEVVEALDRVEAQLWRREWPGMGGKSDRDALVALLKFGRECGTLIPSGVRVSVSIRAWALRAALSKRAMLDYQRGGETKPGVISRLKRAGVIRSDSLDRRDGEAGAFVLVLPSETTRAEFHHSPTTELLRGEGEGGGETLRAPRLRWSALEIRRLGKSRGAVIDALDAAGGTMTLDELADALHIGRVRDLRRRLLPPLVEAAVVECAGATVALTPDWRGALDRDRERAGEIAAKQRDRERYERERIAYRERHKHRPSKHRANTRADGYVSELHPEPGEPPERQVERQDSDPKLSPLAEALTTYLQRNPRRSDELPGWLSVALWAEEYTPTKPPPEEIARLLPLVAAELAA